MALELQNMAVVGDELAFSFTDGFEGFISLATMRRACPCASCQGEPDALGRVFRPQVVRGPGAFDLVKLDTVGGYAVQPAWKDGHATGIYTFAYLRKLAELPPVTEG